MSREPAKGTFGKKALLNFVLMGGFGHGYECT
jgi:hypothetical protein